MRKQHCPKFFSYFPEIRNIFFFEKFSFLFFRIICFICSASFSLGDTMLELWLATWCFLTFTLYEIVKSFDINGKIICLWVGNQVTAAASETFHRNSSWGSAKESHFFLMIQPHVKCLQNVRDVASKCRVLCQNPGFRCSYRWWLVFWRKRQKVFVKWLTSF